MVKDLKPLSPKNDILYYSGGLCLICLLFGLFSIFGNGFKITVPSIIGTIIFGFLTKLIWDSRCKYCKRPFSKKEKLEWKEDMGIRKEPYTYYSKVKVYSDGTREEVEGSRKTVMRDKQFSKHFHICKYCEYGSDKEWNEEKGHWIGETPQSEIIKVKGNPPIFGENLFENEYYKDPKTGQRKTIPKGVKLSLWKKYYGKKYEAPCYIQCGRTIDTHHFHAGHVKSVANGGGDEINNLRPICSDCNYAMQTQNLYDYKKKHYPNS